MEAAFRLTEEQVQGPLRWEQDRKTAGTDRCFRWGLEVPTKRLSLWKGALLLSCPGVWDSLRSPGVYTKPLYTLKSPCQPRKGSF